MPTPTITIHVGAPDPSWCPADFQDLCAKLDQLVTGVINGSYAPYIVSQGNPAVNDQDKLWIKLDNAGRPIGTFMFYQGNWRRTYSGKMGELAYFAGNPITYFDPTGKGLLGLDWDGWALCNGQNGTADHSDSFIVVAHLNNEAGTQMYSTDWQSTINGVVEHEGGSSSVILDPSQVPRATRPAIQAALWSADGNARSASGTLWGQGGNPELTLLDKDNGVPDPLPVKIVPTYFAAALCQFIGY